MSFAARVPMALHCGVQASLQPVYILLLNILFWQIQCYYYLYYIYFFHGHYFTEYAATNSSFTPYSGMFASVRTTSVLQPLC